MRKRVVIVDDREEGFELEKVTFTKENAELLIRPCKSEDELINTVRDAHVVIFTFSKITSEVIDRMNKCELIIRYGVGLENVDICKATEKQIYVCNTPDYGTHDVAEHAVILLMSTNRRLTTLDSQVRNCIWDLDHLPSAHRLRKKTLGILGFGSIGRSVCKKVIGFDLRVLVHDPYIDDETIRDHGVEESSFDRLIRESDYVSVHAPLTDETHHLFDERVFQGMKATSIIVNTSRGDIINQRDLISALKSGLISGAGLDVFEDEPLEPGNELLAMSNVVLTPHVAWYTEESMVDLHQELIDDVIRVLRDLRPLHAVNYWN